MFKEFVELNESELISGTQNLIRVKRVEEQNEGEEILDILVHVDVVPTTYARAMKNTVAFGPLFPGAKDSAHQKDEFISVSDLKKCCELYAHAIYELATG